MLGAIQPEGVHTAVIGGIEDLPLAVAIEVGHGRIGLVVLDDAIFLTQGRACIDRWTLPVIACRVETATVGVEQVQAVVLARGVAHVAVIHVAGDHYFHRTITVDVGDHGRTVGKIGAIALLAHAIAFAPAAELDGQALPHADPAPALPPVHRMGRDLRAVRLVGADIVHVGRDDNLAQAIAIQIADGGIVVKDAIGVAAVIGQLGPASAERAVMLIDPGIDLAIDRARHDDFQGTIGVQIVDGQAAQLLFCRPPGPAGLKVALVVIHRDIAPAVRGDDLEVAVAIQVRDHDARPGTPHVAGARLASIVAGSHTPLQLSGDPVEGHDGVGRSDHLHGPVAIQISDCRGGIPAGLTPGGVTTALLPLELRRLEQRQGGSVPGSGQRCHQERQS